MQYIVNDISIFHKGKLYRTGSIISLSVSEGKALSGFLSPVKVKNSISGENSTIKAIQKEDSEITTKDKN